MGPSDAFVGVGVGSDPAVGAAVKRVDRGDLLVGELEVEDVEVLGHPLGLGGLGDRDDPVLHVPAQDHLRDGLVVAGGDPAIVGSLSGALL